MNRPLFSTLFFAAGLTLEVEAAEDELPVQGDELRLRRAIDNLLRNALEAVPKGGRVVLRTFLYGRTNGQGRMAIAIEDSGPGMEASVREKIFEPSRVSLKNLQHLLAACVRNPS